MDEELCPQSGKIRYLTRKAALEALEIIRARGDAGAATLVAYPCGKCQGTHLGALPAAASAMLDEEERNVGYRAALARREAEKCRLSL